MKYLTMQMNVDEWNRQEKWIETYSFLLVMGLIENNGMVVIPEHNN